MSKLREGAVCNTVNNFDGMKNIQVKRLKKEVNI